MTNKIVMRTIEQFMNGFKPSYNSIMPLFLDNAQQYEVEAGKVNFQRLEAVGDIRSKHLTPKDTEIHQIGAKAGSKSFKKYFLGSQFIQSNLQSTQGYEDVVAQVLDEHNKQSDEMFLLGEGTGTGDVQNNGLYWSADPNYTLETSYEIQKATDGTWVADMYSKLIGQVQSAQDISGDILVLVYGSTLMPVYNGLFPANSQPFSKVIGEALPEVSFAKLPSAVTPSSANGWIIVNRDQVKLHYTTLPKVMAQGTNEEKMYAWTNFLMGSSMLEVLAKGAVTRQPVTLEA